MPDEERFVKHEGVQLRVRESGRGDALILVHGWALDLEMWAPQFESLGRNYRVIAYDRRGFGLSSGTPSIEHDAADLHALFGALALRKASLVGMSQGARAVLRFAQQHRELVSCLVLDGPPRILHMNEPGSREIPLARYREMVSKNGIDAFRREWQQHALMQLHTRDSRRRDLLGSIIARYPGHDLLSEEVVASLTEIDWSKLEIPTLVLTGELDSSERYAAAAGIRHAAIDARQLIVPGAGHLPNLDNPVFYNQAVDAFVRSQSVPTTGTQKGVSK